jgi:hypothetical protein
MRREHPYQTGFGHVVGGIAPYAMQTLAFGPVGAAASVLEMGLSGAADTYDDAISKGATEKLATDAAGWSPNHMPSPESKG